IFGQDSAIQSLRDAYRAERMPHAMLFAGPVGVGKATTARALGALWLCENPKNESPCGNCASCRLFDAANHPDFHVIVKELIRYRMIQFASLPSDLVKSQLKNRGIDAGVAASAAAFADGSLGLALKWIEDGVIDSAQQLTQQLDAVIDSKSAPALAEWFKKAA